MYSLIHGDKGSHKYQERGKFMCTNPDCCDGWIEGDMYVTWGGDVAQYATPCPDCTPPRGAEDIDSEPMDIEVPEGMELRVS